LPPARRDVSPLADFLVPIDLHYRPVIVEALPTLGNGELAKLVLPVQLSVGLFLSFLCFYSQLLPDYAVRCPVGVSIFV